MKTEIAEITKAVDTKNGRKLIFWGLLFLVISIGIITWGLIRFFIISPTVWVFTGSDRRHNKRLKKAAKIESKRKLKLLKKGGSYEEINQTLN